ncbi:Sodium/calcium exchanger protein [Histomonas meleagridis]|uniref:Sodium/calcium exchanger protein n=1 Tax=Histomonas meleagridis TaxID=135588 RepID=UPI00355953A8|nr:Sodium/calcium exchanger protein [Histomonas meleagridis]KAH0805912.1 Sodium/calcium exchanger protein [Histomonas meleagridis]
MREELLTITDSYTNPNPPNLNSEQDNVHHEYEEQHYWGIRPTAPRSDINLPAIEAMESFKTHKNFSPGKFIWCLLIGWWVSLFYFLTGILFMLTVIGYKNGLFCFRFAAFIIYPFGRYGYRENNQKFQMRVIDKILWAILSPIYGIASILGMALSWELVYYIPMAKFLFKGLQLCFQDPTSVKFEKLVNQNPQNGHFPVMLQQNAGSAFYFKFSIFSIEVVYINFIPFLIIALICGFLAPKGSFLDDPLFGTFMALFGAIPCAYVIGICVDDLSHSLGLVLGAILNGLFLSIVELILYYFSLRQNLADVVRAAVTGAFLMNLLIIPGFGMLAAGLKWNEVILNKKSQSVSGTFLLLAIVSVLFPSVFYHAHSNTVLECIGCLAPYGNTTGPMNCSMCHSKSLTNIQDDPIYQQYAGKLMYSMSIIMPCIYIIGIFFSLKTHAHIYENEKKEGAEHSQQMKTPIAVVLLLVATVLFSVMAHVMTEKIPHAIDKLGFSQRFVGLVFYTLIPNCAEYVNSIKFALNGNIGLSMEIGNQGAIITALVEMPALVLLSYVLNKVSGYQMFTLIFPIIDIFCVIVAVMLRNSILNEKHINYFTGISFLLIFVLISVVYFFEFF